MTLISETINAAQGLATFDWPVFPVNPDTKAPFITGWKSRATCDRSSIVDLFKNYPSAAIGLVTGQKSGLIVIDIDERENFSGLQNSKNAGHDLSQTVTASTPQEGAFIYTSKLHRVKCHAQSQKLPRAQISRPMADSSLHPKHYEMGQI